MKKKKIKITKKMTFREVLEKCPESVEVFASFRLYCIGCPAAPIETIEQGCKVHGIDPDKFVKELNKKCGKNARI